jgi:hypothetical protein
MRRIPGLLTILAVCAACAVGGCAARDEKARVTGTVLLDKKPLAGARVEFWPSKNLRLGTYSGYTDEQGHFEMAGDPRFGKGVRPGSYRVMVTKFPVPAGTDPSKAPVPLPFHGRPGPPSQVPGIYGDRDRTPLTAEVKSGENDLPPFALNSKAGE